MAICCQFQLQTITYFFTISHFRYLIKTNQFEYLWLYSSKRADYSDEWRSSIGSRPLFGNGNHSTGSSSVRSSRLLYPIWPFHSQKARFYLHIGVHEQNISIETAHLQLANTDPNKHDYKVKVSFTGANDTTDYSRLQLKDASPILHTVHAGVWRHYHQTRISVRP